MRRPVFWPAHAATLRQIAIITDSEAIGRRWEGQKSSEAGYEFD
jgi:hypothetical protein